MKEMDIVDGDEGRFSLSSSEEEVEGVKFFLPWQAATANKGSRFKKCLCVYLCSHPLPFKKNQNRKHIFQKVDIPGICVRETTILIPQNKKVKQMPSQALVYTFLV